MGAVAEPSGCGLTGALRLGVIYYHCRDYRQASGAPVSLFTGYRVEQLETGQGMPKVYESRVLPGRPPVLLRRWRDATLSYKAETLPGEVYVMVGVFDNPEPFELQTHARVTQKPEWLYIRDELPRYRESSKPQ